ncbi:MAG: sigma-70 family RNA polymerase sigma factor [Pseudomonadales bacterium]|nr:sigma-70 family RNA polymerase sigma factor [Pseudomonadales bacterium]NRA14233.1 sigma-70 family RNA polymerase sigma factor [Oceanospirillaceae bacterium]
MKHQPSELFEQYQRKLLSFIRQKVATPQDAEDILSQVFVKLLEQKDSPDNPVAWLYQVAKNAIIDHYRRRRPTAELPAELINKEQDRDQFQQFSACLKPMLQALDPPYSEALLLADIQGLKQAQVAQHLGISLSAMKSRLLRGRLQLQQLLQQCCPAQRDALNRLQFSDTNLSCKSC